MADERGKARRKVHPRSLANLKPVKPGEVRNPLGINGTASQRFRLIFEEEANEERLRELARAALARGRLRELILERLWPKTERLEVGGIGDVETAEREAAKARLEKLLARKGGA